MPHARFRIDRPSASLAAILVAVIAFAGIGPGGARAADRGGWDVSPPPSAEPPPTPDGGGSRRGVIPTPAPTPVPSPTPSPTPPSETGPVTLGSTVRFHGRGYGHGVGLSQYGARGRAIDGQSAATILAHYYQGTTLGSIPLDTPIRVRVLEGFAASASNPLVVVGRRGAWRIDGVATVFPDGARLEARPTRSKVTSGPAYTWRVKVVDPAGTVLRDTPGPSSVRLRGSTAATVFQVASRTSSYDLYRGTIRVGLNATSGQSSATDELPMEHYLRGVVPAEMPSSWPTPALEAQSIAARSYAARRLRPDVSYFDVEDDTSAQVFLGLLAEKATTTAAIDSTAGVVLKNGAEIVNAMFHSTGGGATEHNENVYVSASGAKVAGAVSYLRGAPDRRADGTAFDDASPYATWSTAIYTRTQLSSWFGSDSRTNVGSITALDLRNRGVSGRLIAVRLIGSLGTKTVSGDVFRSIFNAHRPAGDPMLRSTLFDTKPVP
jgi:SpoIID/LytB domain protein